MVRQEQEIRNGLTHIFSTVLRIPEDEITDELSPDTCENWDSLRQIQLCIAIDETFGLTLDITKQIEILNFRIAVLTVIEELDAR